MVKKKELATNIMSALPFMLIAAASLLALVPEASCSAGKTSAPQQATKKSSSPSETPPSSSPAFPPHYFDRSTPPLTIRHVSSTEGDLHPPPPPSGRHARLHHPHFPPSSLRRRPSQGGSGGETAPPYAVQMEPLVKYSPRDPLYANEGGAEGEDKKEEKRVAEGPEKEPSQSLDVEEEALVEDLEGGAATLRALHAEDKSSSGHPVHNYPPDSSRGPYSFHSPSPLYGPHPHHGQPPFPQGPRYVILREPEPIIEIIVKESNQTLPEPPPAPVTLPAKPREPVHVFYVKYERKKGKSGGEERVVFDTPVPARQPTSPEPLPPVHIPEEIEDAKRPLPIVPLPHPLPLSVETTTLRAVIHPESETVHHPHSRSPALRVTFGEGRAHTQDGEVVEEEQSAPQPSFVAPAWGGAGPSPVPPFRQLPEQHFRGHQGASRYFGPSQPHQQFGPQQPTQFPQQQFREGQTPDSRTFPPLSRLPPPPGLGHQSVGQNLYAHGQGIRYGQGFPPSQYHPELQQQQQAHLRQQQLQQFQQQNQQKHLQQLQEQRKQQQHQQNQQHHQHQLNQQHQHHQQQQQHQQGLQFQRFPTQLPPGVPSFHVPQRPHSIPSPPPSAQSYQNHHLVPHGSTAPPFIRLPNHQGGRFPEPPNQGSPATGGDIIKSISHSEQHHVHSPAAQAHSISVEHKEHNQLPKGHASDPQITRSQPVGPQRPHQQQPQFLRQQHQQEYKAQSLNSEPNRQQAPVPNLSVQPQRQQQYNGGTPPAAHNGFNGARPDSANRINNGVSQQQHNAVTPSPTPGPSYGTTILHYPTTPSNPIQQINSLGLNSDHRGAHPSSLPRGTTPQPPPSTTPTPASTTHKIPDLPDEIPDDLRQQLLSSGILDNADIQILDYDKVGDIPIESLPPEALAGLQGAGSENKPVAVALPPSRGKEAVEMKVVRYTPGNEEKAVDGLIRHDVEETRVLAPVTTSQESDVNPEGFRRYLPLRISGERFPLPDVPELRGRNVTSVVVLAPVGFPDRGRERRAEGEAEERAGGEAGELLASGRLNALVKDPSRENFRVWLEAEKKASPEEQAVVLLVSPKDGEPEEKGDIFMLDVSSGQVSQLRGELSAAFVQVAKANAKDSGLVEEGRSKSKR